MFRSILESLVLRRKLIYMYLAAVFLFSMSYLTRDLMLLMSRSRIRYTHIAPERSARPNTTDDTGNKTFRLSTEADQLRSNSTHRVGFIDSGRLTTGLVNVDSHNLKYKNFLQHRIVNNGTSEHRSRGMCCKNSSLISKVTSFGAPGRGGEHRVWNDADDGKSYRVPCDPKPDLERIWKEYLPFFDPGGLHRNDEARKRGRRWELTMKLEQMLADPPPSGVSYLCHIIGICEREKQKLTDFNESVNICPCLPAGLRGRLQINQGQLLNTSWQDLRRAHPTLQSGGHWTPSSCMARRRIAVIVPFRDRVHHLHAFLAHIHPILQRQMVEYRIFIVEQNLPYMFNKAAVMNAGYLEAKKLFDADCVLFHDVDTLVENDDNMVMCDDRPIHWGAYNPRFRYRMWFKLFGAAVLLPTSIFENINGFTNLFFGWGGEDDILRRRLIQKKFHIYRPPLDVGRCQIIWHARDPLFRVKIAHKARKGEIFEQMMVDPFWQEVDGLSTAAYDVITTKEFTTHTWIHVDLKRPVVDGKAPTWYHECAREMADQAFGKIAQTYISKRKCTTKIIDDTRHFLSRVACKFKCDSEPSCVKFEYHVDVENGHGSYCILLGETDCEDIIEIHSKHVS